jgi:putative transposase
MFVVVTATFRLLYALVVLGHERRKVIHFDVAPNPTQDWLARQITEAFPWLVPPVLFPALLVISIVAYAIFRS